MWKSLTQLTSLLRDVVALSTETNMLLRELITVTTGRPSSTPSIAALTRKLMDVTQPPPLGAAAARRPLKTAKDVFNSLQPPSASTPSSPERFFDQTLQETQPLDPQPPESPNPDREAVAPESR